MYPEMATWIQLLNLIIFIAQVSTIEHFRFFLSDTELNHLRINNGTGDVYVGAVNRLYQLDGTLNLHFNVTTGPELDHKKCTPPIDLNQCPNAAPTDNYNKLLLLDVPKERIVVCGSIYKGICSLRKLGDISSEQLFYDDSRGEKSFVVSNDEKVETVGLVTDMTKDGPQVLFVGKGTSQHDNGIIISTRILDEADDKGPFETYVDSATFKHGWSSASTQQFVTVFEDPQRVYFISSLLDKNNGKNRTFITRLCKSDYNYFSYVEMDLVCTDGNIPYNICTSAYLASPGQKLANAMGITKIDDKVLFGVFSTFYNNQEKSALCMFSLDSINKKFEENRELCYTSPTEPVSDDGESIFSKPFGEKMTGCGGKKHPIEHESVKYPCGSEHLAYPLQSKNGVVAKAVLTREHNPYTSVAVSVENEHTIAFLGTAEGKLIKAFLHEPSREYRAVSFDTKSTVKNGMVFDPAKEHVYVMTKKKVHRVPVQDCSRYSDCNECTQAKDPYCGWCVIDGKCTLKKDCNRANEPYNWLWSPDVVCLKIESAQPSNMSVKYLSNIMLTFAPSIKLHESDHLKCNYGENNKTAILEDDGSVSCPHPDSIPTTVTGQDYVNVTIKLFLMKNDVFVADYIYQFYNCEESMNLSENLPCISCVTTQWKCQWDIRNHKCVDASPSTEPNTISLEDDCPQFYQPVPSFIPMELESTIRFYGKNLNKLESKSFIAGNDKLKFTARVLMEGAREVEEEDLFAISIPKLPSQDEESTALDVYIKLNNQKIDSRLNVNVYNCFFGRSDCSLCRAADPKYQCVWCNTNCVYKDMCNVPSAMECPNPSITDFTPKAAPLNGGILLTIMGSNLGITSTDVEEIKVAGVNCTFRPENYSVSTRVICEVGPAHYAQSGNINILVNKKEGISPSSLTFTYQEPEPTSVRPDKGVLAGGTSITISGNNLETGSKNDVKVSLDGFPCKVISFGEEIVCITSQAKQEGTFRVRLSYGMNTVKEAGKFTYRSNPKIVQFNPDRSFASGGRTITISGIGFDLVQNFSMMATSQSKSVEKQDILKKVNDTVIIFSSPQVPENYLNSEVTVMIKMDGFETPLETADLSFNYVPDPSFDNFTDGIKKQVNNLINAKGNKLNDAMTIEEAKAFVGEGVCKINTLTATDLYCVPPEEQPPPRRRHKRDTADNLPEFRVQFGNREWILGKVEYGQSPAIPLNIIIPVVLIPMILIIVTAVYFYRRKSQQAEREYEKVKQQLEGLEESVRDRCKKEFTDLMIEMEDQTNYLNETGIPFLDYKMYTDRVFFWPSKDGEKDVMITGKLDIPEARRQTVEQALNQFSNLLNSKSFLTIFIHTLESQKDFSAREKLYFASLLTVALHGKLEYYTDIMRTLFVELMEQYVAKNPKLMLRRSETVVERMLSNWMSICLYQYLKDTAGEHLYKLFKAIKHQVEKGPVDAVQIKAKYTLNDTGLLGDDVEYTQLTVNVIVQDEGLEPVPVKVLNCDTITQVKEKIVEQVYKNLPYSHRPKADSLALEWRPGSTAQILSDLDLTSQKEGRSKRINTLMHYNVRDNATLILSRIGISQQQEENHQDFPGERHALLEDENKVWHLVRPADEVDDGKSKRGSMKGKEQTKAITEIYLTRLLSVKGTLQQFVDNFFHSVLNSNQVVPPAVKYFFDFLDEQAEKYEIKDEDTVHIWKTNSLSLRFWVNILKNPHFIFDVHVHQVVDASLSVIAQTFMDACSRTEHKLSRESPSNKLLYAKEISTYKKMVEDYYKGIRQMVQVSDQDMNTHLAEISRAHTESLNTLVALHQLYQYTKKYYDDIINALEEDPSAQRMQLAIRLQQIAAALENKVTDL